MNSVKILCHLLEQPIHLKERYIDIQVYRSVKRTTFTIRKHIEHERGNTQTATIRIMEPFY
jgi:hypothetical protein